MGGGADRLSNLSDDLLASVISLLPTREAVRTAALSRRWRPVWLRAHSLVLDSRSYGDDSQDIWAYVGRHWDDGTQDRLFSDARNFLDAAGRCSPIRNLSLSVHGRDKDYFQHVMGQAWGASRGGYDLMVSLLGASALRHLEEVRVKFDVVKSPAHCGRKMLTGPVYLLDPSELPQHTLRVLDLEHCGLESPPNTAASVSFPRLSSLRLYRCSTSMDDLEGWIQAAPGLGSVHIQDHDFDRPLDGTTRRDGFLLQSSSLTALTLLFGSWRITTTEHYYEIDVPRLRSFKYKGSFETFSMKSQTAELARVDLAIHREPRIRHKDGDATNAWFPRFWRFMRNFRHVKAIKLKVPNIEDIAVVDKAVRHEHLFTFPTLECLELKGFSDPGHKDDASLAIANLLQCCPVLHGLKIRIRTDPYRTHYTRTSTTKVQVSDFDVSMDLFRRRFSKGVMVHLMLDEHDANGSSQVAAVLPGLTGCRFRCLDSHLKIVTLQFELKEMNSFEVCLAKFFAENCMVLEVLQIDDGKQNFLTHLNWMVERWRANASKQRKQMECDSSKQMGKRKRNYRAYNAE